MAKAYIFYNPLANNNKGADVLPELNAFIHDETVKCDMTKIDYTEIISSMEDDDYIVICGGDGTLNRFANTVDCENLNPDVLYYAAGTGNDFANDLGKTLSGVFNDALHTKHVFLIFSIGRCVLDFLNKRG